MVKYRRTILYVLREGKENMLSQNRSPSRGFANEAQMDARLSSR